MSDPVPNLLVVDDNEDNRYTLVRRLKRQGYENVAIAVDGREALAMLERDRFDLVLLDIMMPEVDGYEVLKRIKLAEGTRDIPVIMISALDEIESVVRCIELGAEDYLPKPFNPTLLRARVGACLEKKRLRDQEISYRQQIEQEKRRGDELLHAILPGGAVQELKASDRVQPRRYENVAVLFCDIVGFTAYCDRHAPEQVVAELQVLVGRFEEIVAAHGLEKIKTIGDAFLATAGLLLPCAAPARTAIDCAFELVRAAAAAEPHWQVRVGLHQGPVVAGVVGHSKFLYDLWGDTVNLAARLTEHAEGGAVCINADTWRLVSGHYAEAGRSLVEIKGKGPIELIQVSPPA